MDSKRNIIIKMEKKHIKYNDLLDQLFDQWEREYSNAEKERFCRDGLLYKSDYSININALWEESSIRILFLLKDNPDGAQDVRNWLIDKQRGDENRLLKNTFIKNIAYVFFGLIKVNEGVRLGYSDVKKKESEVLETWNRKPFALMECKKNAGGSEVSLQEMRKAFNDYKVYLSKEIDILKPTVIICCDGEDSQYDFITKEYFVGENYEEKKYYHPEYKEKLECCLRLYRDKVFVIKSYHPSYRGDASRIYERVISPFGALMEELKKRNNG